MLNLSFFSRSIFFALILTTSILGFSQELNDNFLSSLPKSIQSDFLGMAEDEETSDIYPKRPDTRIQKIESGIDEVKKQLTSMEASLYRQENQGVLEVFGSNFFNSYQATFAPINQENFTSDYVLDVGDVLTVQSVGSQNLTASRTKNKLIISRDGTINIPDLGLVYIAGLPYQDAIETIKQFAKSKSIATEVFINLDRARDMNVLLVGNAANPGMYTLPGGSSVLSLLHSAGGINENGSYRSLKHKRNNTVIGEIDLYDVLIDGNLSFQSPLRSGDSVIIGPVQRQSSISGGINTPAIYELANDEHLDDLIAHAQGFSPSSGDEITVHRASGTEESFSKDLTAQIVVQHGDSFKVKLYSPENQNINTVTITGAVARPGQYSFKRGDLLSQIIMQAGGYLDSSYPEGGLLFRKKVAEVQKENFQVAYNQLINFLASGGNAIGGMGLGSSTNLQAILSELKSAKFSGRLSAEFNLNKIAKDRNLDTVIAEGDVIHVPFFSSDVYVVGDIQNPGGRRYSSDLNYSDYIKKSGGFGKFADQERIIVIQPNGDASVVSRRFLFGTSDVDIYPGSTIFIPREIGKLEGISYVATLAPIMSSLALSLASLNSIK
ncbi:SLBB domain-containing protein [Gammaproteobacteria bacterium]|nr:SLBB domain-containing protein [Gammaproteobacteria bacterium]